MAGGLIGLGKSYSGDAKSTFSNLSGMEQNRNAANERIEAQRKAQRSSNVGTGAGLGMMAGMQSGSSVGPWGAVIGAAVGYLASELF